MTRTSGASIPLAEEAEKITAALCAVGRNSASDVRERVDPCDFYWPAHQRIVEHSLDQSVLDAEDAMEIQDKLETRVAALAKASNVDVAYVRELATDWAHHGQRFAAPRDVTAAARRRDLMNTAADLYNLAGSTALDEMLHTLDRLVALRDQIVRLDLDTLAVARGAA